MDGIHPIMDLICFKNSFYLVRPQDIVHHKARIRSNVDIRSYPESK